MADAKKKVHLCKTLHHEKLLVVDEVFTIAVGWTSVFFGLLRRLGSVEEQTHPGGGVQVICKCARSTLVNTFLDNTHARLPAKWMAAERV